MILQIWIYLTSPAEIIILKFESSFEKLVVDL